MEYDQINIIEQNSIKFINIIIDCKNLNTIIDYYDSNNNLINIEYSFCYACENGMLNVAKCLMLVKHDINVSVDDEWSFCKACENGHLEVAKWLIEIKPTINISIDDNYSFIHACNNEHIEIVKWLHNIKKSLIINIDVIALIINNIDKTELVDFLFDIIPEGYMSLSDWENTFIASCSTNKLKLAKMIFRKIKNINIFTKNNEPFYLACRNGHLDIFIWLIELDPNIHKKYSINNYAFYKACSNGHYNIVSCFLKYNTKTSIEINDINVGLIEACENGYLDIVKFFIENYEINISVLNDAFDKTVRNNNSTLYYNSLILRYLYSYSKKIKISNKTLEILALKQNLSIIKCFYRTNYKMKFSDKFIINAFLGFSNCLKLHKWLLKIYPDLNLSINNNSIFRDACKYGKLKLIRWLLKIRPNINLLNENYDYLQNLFVYGYTDIIKIVIQKNPLILDRNIRNIFIYACTNNNYTILKWILKSKSHEINQSDIEFGFYKSCKYDYLKIAKLIYKTFKNIIESTIEINLSVICEFNSQDTAQWIVSLYPKRFLFKYNSEDKLENFIIFENLILPKTNSSNLKKNIKECCICQDNVSDIVTHCNHYYCKYCIIKWIFKSNNCPYCRSKLKIKNLKFIN